MTVDRADLVIVGGGTIGGWAAWFAGTSGVGRVVVLEAATVGSGASSRAAGIVRAQGGTPATVALGRFSIDFYRGQAARLGIDSGFRELGYLILAVTDDEAVATRERIEMTRRNGVLVDWVTAAEAVRLAPTLVPHGFVGASYLATDGCIDPPRNVLAYTLAMRQSGVDLRERTAFTGLRLEAASGGGRRVVGVETSAGPIETGRVLLTGGPSLATVGRLAGLRIPAGAVRHTVAVLEPHGAFQGGPQPMVFDVGRGLYWRQEEDGLLFGWSNPDERPGPARSIDWPMVDEMRGRLAGFVPVTRDLAIRRIWAATIDFTPDHLPILGPAVTPDGERLVGVTVASAGGHGMMWGPGVARVAADLVVTGRTDLIDVTDLGLERFDADGRSRLAPDPIALPFPTTTGS